MDEPTPSATLRGEAVLEDALVSELVVARLVAVLSTYDPAGFIHSTPMWYARDGGVLILATSSRSRKVRNLAADGRATLVLHDSRPGYEVCGASIVGLVEIVRPPAALSLVDLVHGRYLAVDAAGDESTVAYLDSDDVALRLTPLAALTWDERESVAARVVRARGWALPLVTTESRS